MNSLPLSEFMAMMGMGNTLVACWIASKTRFWALLRTDRFTVQPVATSVPVSVKQNSPWLVPPSWPSRSISTKPCAASSQARWVAWEFGYAMVSTMD